MHPSLYGVFSVSIRGNSADERVRLRSYGFFLPVLIEDVHHTGLAPIRMKDYHRN